MSNYGTKKHGVMAPGEEIYTSAEADAKFPAAKIYTTKATTAQATAGKIEVTMKVNHVIGAPLCIASAGTVRAITKVEIASSKITVTITSLAKDDVLTFLYD